MFIIENITDIFLPIWTLWVRCAWCLDLHTSVFRIWNLNLRTFVAKYWRGDLRTFWRKILKARFTRICRETFTPGFTHFFRNFFLTEKAIPQTFSLLKCMDEISNLNQCWIWFSSQERKAELERREKEEEEREKEETRREEEFSKVDFMMKWWKMRASIGWQRVQSSFKGSFKSSTYKLLF